MHPPGKKRVVGEPLITENDELQIAVRPRRVEDLHERFGRMRVEAVTGAIELHRLRLENGPRSGDLCLLRVHLFGRDRHTNVLIVGLISSGL
ncbi:MAG: hypothetical protein R3E54_12720 [Halioglobus sp.]